MVRNPNLSFAKISADIEKLVGLPLIFAADCIGTTAELAVTSQKTGGVVLLENTRFHEGERKTLSHLQNHWQNWLTFTATMPSLRPPSACIHRGDCHLFPIARQVDGTRATISRNRTYQAGKTFNSDCGRFKGIYQARFTQKSYPKVDTPIVGGGMANTFLLAKGFSIGASLAEHKMKNNACMILDTAQKAGCKILLPSDVVVAKQLNSDVENFVVPITDCLII